MTLKERYSQYVENCKLKDKTPLDFEQWFERLQRRKELEETDNIKKFKKEERTLTNIIEDLVAKNRDWKHIKAVLLGCGKQNKQEEAREIYDKIVKNS